MSISIKKARASVHVTPAARPQVAKAKTKLWARDELSNGKGGALRARAAKLLQSAAPRPVAAATYTVVPGDSYNRIAQNLATAKLAAAGMSPSAPGYSEAWHRAVYTLVGQLMTANGNRPLHPGDQLLLPPDAVTPPVAKPPVAQTPVTPPLGQTPKQGPVTPPVAQSPTAPSLPVDAGNFVNQFAGDPNGRNGNCGFASALMALRALGVSTGLTGSDYDQAMQLRKLGGGGTDDSAWGSVGQVVAALNGAGGHATAVPNTWGSNKLDAVELMKQAFLDGSQVEAFVAAGNPSRGWPDKVSYNGGHFVTVTGYDAASNTFTVLDPIAKGPIQVTPEQLAAYLEDGNAEAGELIEVTR